MLHVHVTLFNISDEKIEPLIKFLCNISCGEKKVMSPLICLIYQSLILLCREYEISNRIVKNVTRKPK